MRVVVLRGAGEGAFIGGADIRVMVDLTPEASRPFITSIHGLCTTIPPSAGAGGGASVRLLPGGGT